MSEHELMGWMFFAANVFFAALQFGIVTVAYVHAENVTEDLSDVSSSLFCGCMNAFTAILLWSVRK